MDRLTYHEHTAYRNEGKANHDPEKPSKPERHRKEEAF